MATIVVEDGTGLTNSNSYGSEADLTTYATDRGVTITGTNAILLIQAMDYIEQQNYKGVKSSDDQALLWPRYGVMVNGYEVPVTTIPQLLIDSLFEVALAIDAGNNPLATVDRQTKKETVGPISVEYMDGALDSVYLKAAETKLSKLLYPGGSMSARVFRG